MHAPEFDASTVQVLVLLVRRTEEGVVALIRSTFIQLLNSYARGKNLAKQRKRLTRLHYYYIMSSTAHAGCALAQYEHPIRQCRSMVSFSDQNSAHPFSFECAIQSSYMLAELSGNRIPQTEHAQAHWLLLFNSIARSHNGPLSMERGSAPNIRMRA